MTDNLEAISLHKKTPKIVNAIVEIPKGTSAKYEYDSELNMSHPRIKIPLFIWVYSKYISWRW